MANELAVFADRIRKVWHGDEWWFSVVDVVEVLTDSPNPRNYWNMLKVRLREEGHTEVLSKVKQLKLLRADRKMRLTDTADEATVQAITRLIPRQAIHTRHRRRSGYIYAIQSTAGGLVKLGYAKNIPLRLGQIQNMCPIPLRIIWHTAGTMDDEEALHTAFASRRQHGEWFDLQGLDVPYELSNVLARPQQKGEKVS